MFASLLHNNYASFLKKDAAIEINKDRKIYKEITKNILSFVTEENTVISNIDLLLGNNLVENLNVYADNDKIIEDLTKNIMQNLCNKFGEEFLLKIIEWDFNYSVEYNLRNVCNIKNIYNKLYTKSDIDLFEKVKKYSIIKNILLDETNKNSLCKMHIYPPILELIKLYKDLYNPSKAAKWEELLEIILKIESIYELKHMLKSDDKNLQSKKINTAIAHKDKDNKNKDKDKDSKSNKVKKSSYLNNIVTSDIILNFILNGDYIFVGKSAYFLEHIINKSQKEDMPILEIISKNDIQIDIRLLRTYFEKFIKDEIIYKEQSINVPEEIMLKKYSIYTLNNSNNYTHIMNIYNNMTYELINYNKVPLSYKKYKIDNVIKVADPIVQLRFIYIDLWNKMINDKKVNIDKYLSIVDYYKEKVDIKTLKTNYDGHYVDNSVYRKKLNILNPNKNKYSYYCNSF